MTERVCVRLCTCVRVVASSNIIKFSSFSYTLWKISYFRNLPRKNPIKELNMCFTSRLLSYLFVNSAAADCQNEKAEAVLEHPDGQAQLDVDKV